MGPPGFCLPCWLDSGPIEQCLHHGSVLLRPCDNHPSFAPALLAGWRCCGSAGGGTAGPVPPAAQQALSSAAAPLWAG